ncbi:MAG: polymer-forming cytoskeletal protein, partial [Proteobacteria bacterium]|nr:polymer-forming cytoskeletal protein [Pseudomonadota bacterium]
MTKKTVVLVAALTIILSLFTGCHDSLIERLEKVQAHVEISVKLPDTLAPAGFDHENFKYTLTWYPTSDPTNKAEKTFDYAKNIVIVFKFDPVEYMFELRATDPNDSNKTKAYGERAITIQPGQRDNLEIPIRYMLYGDESGFGVDKDGNIILSGTIKVPDGTTLVLDGNVKSEGDLILEGELEINGNFTVDGNLTAKEDFTVNGELDVGGTLDAQKTATITGSTTMGSLAITANTTFDGNLIITGDLAVDTGATFTVGGNLTLKDGMDIEGGLKVNGNLIADKDLDVGGNLEVTGATTVVNELAVVG